MEPCDACLGIPGTQEAGRHCRRAKVGAAELDVERDLDVLVLLSSHTGGQARTTHGFGGRNTLRWGYAGIGTTKDVAG